MDDLINIIGVIIIFASILFLAYVTTKYFASRAGKITNGKYMHIVETLFLGKDKYLHLVKVGNEFILVSSSPKGIELLEKVTIENYEESMEKEQKFSTFKNILKNNLNSIKNIMNEFEYKRNNNE